MPNTTQAERDVVALAAIAQSLTVARSVSQIAAIITRTARQHLQADGATFAVLDGAECYYSDESAGSPLWRGKRFPVGECLSGWCVREGRPAVTHDIHADNRIPPHAYRPPSVRCVALVPVGVERPIAAFGVYWSASRDPSGDIEFLQSVAAAASHALADLGDAVENGVTPEAQRKKLAADEQRHRVRNILAVVQSIVNRSLDDLPGMAQTINHRISAIIGTDVMLETPGAAGSTVATVLKAELDPYGIGRVRLTGDDIELPADRARALSVVAHEWATNAAKYGAFSTSSGRLAVSWGVIDGALRLSWLESGGPPVTPGRPGFGTRFVERMLSIYSGSSETEFPVSGIVRRLRLPLTPPKHEK